MPSAATDFVIILSAASMDAWNKLPEERERMKREALSRHERTHQHVEIRSGRAGLALLFTTRGQVRR
jgi:hypothetical protein